MLASNIGRELPLLFQACGRCDVRHNMRKLIRLLRLISILVRVPELSFSNIPSIILTTESPCSDKTLDRQQELGRVLLLIS